MSQTLITQDEAASIILAYAFSGAIGSPKGKGVTYALVNAMETTFTWLTALEDYDGSSVPVDRYLIRVDRQSQEVSNLGLLQISELDLAEAILAATGQHLDSSARFCDGLMSISYKVKVQEDPDIAYVVQLRHYGRVASMDYLMTLIEDNIDHATLPVPSVHPIPGEKIRQQITGWGRQISRFIPGEMADTVYPLLSHEEKHVLVQRMALAFQACWQIQLPQPHLIGELIWDEDSGFRVGPDRHFGLGGPFQSVREYLQAHVRSAFVALQKQEGIEEFKSRFQDRIEQFIERRGHDIPATVEDVPIVAVHADMGLHNVIVSKEAPTELEAIIDWEFIASALYASLDDVIETLFREPAANGFGREYDRADELRGAFWDAIPIWKAYNESNATESFLEWHRFGRFLKPEAPPSGSSVKEQEKFWEENIRVVKRMLDRYSCSYGC